MPQGCHHGGDPRLAERYGDEMMPCSDLAPFFRHVDRGQIRTVNAPLSDFVRYVQGLRRLRLRHGVAGLSLGEHQQIQILRVENLTRWRFFAAYPTVINMNFVMFGLL